MDSQLARIFDQMGKTVPLEVGFDRRIPGSRTSVSVTSPIPNQNIVAEPIPQIIGTPSLDDVLTRSSIPIVKGVEPTYLVTSSTQARPKTKPIVPASEVEPTEEIVCEGPQGLCYSEVNQILYDILSGKISDISCACNSWDYYSMTNPSDGTFTWKSNLEFIYRETEQSEWSTSMDYKLKYSRWGPKPREPSKSNDSVKSNDSNPMRLLFLHDALDSRKSWWCMQRLLSPFVDTVSVDMLGTGDSIKPRGLNSSQFNNNRADIFPWSFKLHAEYLVGMAEIIWPGENFYVVGCGWGAQIAAEMAALSEKMSGLIMLNPPGFVKEIHPEIYYSDILNMHRIVSDDDLNNMSVSYIGKIRDAILALSTNSETSKSISPTTMRLILDQYTNLDRKRILIDQLVAISNLQHQELPETKDNFNGIRVQDILCPTLVMAGQNDCMYPPEQRNLYPAIYYNSDVLTMQIPGANHMSHIECPEFVAEMILSFMRNQSGFSALKDSFIGFSGASQGNEKAIITGLRSLYKL